MQLIDWPSELEQCNATKALQNAYAQQRLGHGLLLVGNDLRVLDEAAAALAKALLGGKMPSPDYKHVEPTNKMRQIGVEAMRAMRQFLQTSSHSGVKVSHLSQADRLNTESANLFLKSLEEPPEGAFIIMTSTQPHAILPTLLSRVMRFRLNVDALDDPNYGLIVKQVARAANREVTGGGADVMEDYAFVQSLYESWSNPPKVDAGEAIADMNTDSEGLADAQEAGALRAHRSKVFAAIQQGLWEAFRQKTRSAHALLEALEAVERAAKFMVFSLNEAATLEVAVMGALKAYRK